MGLRAFLALCVAVGLGLNPAQADVYDGKLQSAFDSACNSGLLFDDTNAITRFFYKNSPACKELETAGPDFDVEAMAKRHGIPLNEKDLEVLFHKDFMVRKDPTEIERECTHRAPGLPVGLDRKCLELRTRLEAANQPMSQQDYDKLDRACDRNLDCIDLWGAEWHRGNRALPGSAVPAAETREPESAGFLEQFSYTDLEKQASSGGIDLFSGAPPASASSAGIGFGNIEAGRERVRIDGIKQELFAKNEKIASRCQCALGNTKCYSGNKFDFDQLNSAMARAVAANDRQKTATCKAWAQQVRGKTSDDEVMLDTLLRASDVINQNLDDQFAAFKKYNRSLLAMEKKQKKAIAAQQEKEGGFNLGKFAALATGTVIGGSMSDLPEEEVVKLLGAAAVDSMGGNDGMKTYQSALTGLAEMEARSAAPIVLPDLAPPPSAPPPSADYGFASVSEPATAVTTPLAQTSSLPTKRGNWGAIALSVDGRDNRWGFVLNRATPEEAKAAAIAMCGPGCAIPVKWGEFDQCGAIIQAYGHAGTDQTHPTPYQNTAPTLAKAETGGMQECEAQLGSVGFDCRIDASGCN